MSLEGASAHRHSAYRPDIDGLRAVAVLGVVLFHAFPSLLPGGFIGVDVFFVISGFLISGIILSDLTDGRFSLANFYGRRVRRIFPALIVVLLATAGFGWFALIGDEFTRLGKHVAGAAVFISNFVSLKESGYFDPAAELKPLLHLWSLAVEEQFYLIWPLLTVALWRRRANFLALASGVAIASFAVSVHLTHTRPSLAFYSPLSRFWELMLGCALADLVRREMSLDRWAREALSAAGALLLLLGFAMIDSKRPFPGVWGLPPTVGAMLLIGAGPPAFINAKLLASAPAVWLGRISYPWYLWHWPLLSMAIIVHGSPPPPAVRLLLLVLALLLAWLTYLLVEKPVRSATRPGRAVRIAVASMGAICASAVLAYAGWWHPRNRFPALEAAAQVGDFEYLKAAATGDGARAGGCAPPGTNPAPTRRRGDSHGAQYGPRRGGAPPARGRERSLLFVVGGGCLPIPGILEDAPIHRQCPQILARALQLAAEDRVKTVVVGAAWGQYLSARTPASVPQGDYQYYFWHDGQRVPLRGEAGEVLAMRSLATLLESLSRHARVYLLLDNPSGANFDPYRFLDRHLPPFTGDPVAARASVDPEQLRVRAMLIDVAERAHVGVLDPMRKLCEFAACLRLMDGEPIYKDMSHLSAAWVAQFADYVDPALGAVAGKEHSDVAAQAAQP